MKKLTEWQLQTAKNRFSEVVNRAVAGEPQLVTRHGRPAVVVMSVEDYTQRSTRKPLLETLLSSPHPEIDLATDRDPDSERAVDL